MEKLWTEERNDQKSEVENIIIGSLSIYIISSSQVMGISRLVSCRSIITFCHQNHHAMQCNKKQINSFPSHRIDTPSRPA